MRRGEIWWGDLAPPMGRRPVLLLSRNEAYRIRNQTVSLVTTRVRNIPVEVALGPEDGLPKISVANLDTIMTIPKDQLDKCIVSLTPEKMVAVEDAIRFALGMSR